jgi:rhodanese-related sulfurtransferase
VTVVAIGLATAACAGVEPATSAARSDSAAAADAATVASLPPAEFATALADDDVLVLNVHVPDEGSIAGTDAAIPYDEVRARSAELPQDLDAAVAVYCKSGRMSAVTVGTLRDLGYTDVVELRGGMDAWAADDRELLPPAG